MDSASRYVTNRDKVLVACCKCGKQANANFARVKKVFERHSRGYLCKSCGCFDRDSKNGIRDSEYLSLLGLVDATNRRIITKEHVDATCFSCGETKSVRFGCLADTYERIGRGYLCKNCAPKFCDQEKRMEKQKATMIERYGVEWAMQSEKVKEKIKQTNLEKFGSEHPLQSPEVREKIRQTVSEKNYGSKGELELKAWIQETFPHLTVKKSYCGGANPCEIDIYIPEKKLAIEYNGDYWHSEKFLGKDYHLNKTNLVKSKKNAQLIHIFESEWKNHKERIKAYLTTRLEEGKHVDATQCQIIEIPKEDAQKFCDSCHIQGSSEEITGAFGFLFDDQIISVMAFSGPEMSRYATRSGYFVPGGLSVLSDHASQVLGPFVTFVHKHLSDEEYYEKAGYVKVQEFEPEYRHWNKEKIWSCGKIKYKYKY